MEAFNFIFFGSLSCLLGVIIGGPFRILVIENELIESLIGRIVFGFIFFPPVVGVIGLILYYFFGEEPTLDAMSWGIIIGLTLGMTYSYYMVGKTGKKDQSE